MAQTLLFIFAIQIVYVSAYTLRMILTLKGQKYIAALISMVEIVIYVLGLNLVLNYLDQISALVVYALGYGLGILIGAWIEEKIALGYITVKVICDQTRGTIVTTLREKGYGVTSWLGNGRDGDRLVMEILAKRKNQKKLYETILELDSKAFIITVEPKQFHGGFWTRSIKR
ncbi:DUF2179 domain-containing protein [Paenibacillus gallinarum]|uniref:UPF0316 protein H9647_18230 n=1 Tax=Paenibacillus gallinarum TaxID=2762232 RepID=A0ABR8T2U3_9BACL|nr:DUF2179 domain-containing protein [Paenibacillus gallinarum]MBD7970002.1 DUF2179 domain-containing protein [Paenibacillus gallinarum]